MDVQLRACTYVATNRTYSGVPTVILPSDHVWKHFTSHSVPSTAVMVAKFEYLQVTNLRSSGARLLLPRAAIAMEPFQYV